MKTKENVTPLAQRVTSLKRATNEIDDFVDSRNFIKVIPDPTDREKIRGNYKSLLNEWYSEYPIKEANEKAVTFISFLWLQAAITASELEGLKRE